MDSILITIVAPTVVGVLVGIVLWLLKSVLPDKKGMRGWAKEHIWPHWQWVITSTVLLMMTLVFLGLWVGAPKTTVQITEIEIEPDSPVITVNGIEKGIPSGYSIWVVSFSNSTKRYYVQQLPLPQPKLQYEPFVRWSSVAKAEQDYKVLAVLADQEADKIISEHLPDLKEQGTLVLPDGAQAYDSIIVSMK